MSRLLVPPFLRRGDAIGLVAPAYCLQPEQWQPAAELLRSWGYQVVEGKTLRLRDHRFAGTDRQRLDDLLEMLRRPDVKAILCARGGYGAARLLPDLAQQARNLQPKWLIGYSDATALLTLWTQDLHQLCIHAPMPIDLHGAPTAPTDDWNRLRDLLAGTPPEYRLPAHPFNRQGTVSAPLTGGNLSVLYSLNGTPSQCQTENRILFIEDVGEKLHHLDRMMNSLRLSGQLARLSGLLVGDFTEMNDAEPTFGKTAYEIIRDYAAPYRFPVAFGFPAGHGKANAPLLMGAPTGLRVGTEGIIVKQELEGRG
jgi:muramoyltetrapeptide carboxypeptidase